MYTQASAASPPAPAKGPHVSVFSDARTGRQAWAGPESGAGGGSAARELSRRQRLSLPLARALEDQSRSKPPPTLRPSSSLRLPQPRKCQRPTFALPFSVRGGKWASAPPTPCAPGQRPFPEQRSAGRWQAIRTPRPRGSVASALLGVIFASACQRPRECGL